MTTNTPNLNLVTYNNEEDLQRTFQQFLDDLTGITNSNMTKIDDWGGDIEEELDDKSPLDSPAFTGIPTAPTAEVGTNTTQIATTAFVLANSGGGGTNNDWINVEDVWSRASGSAIFTENDLRLYLTQGTRIRFKQNSGTWKYMVVTNTSSSSEFLVYGGTEYSLLNEPITDAQYSRFINPIGFSEIFTWIPSVTMPSGGTITINNSSCKSWITGRIFNFDISLTLTISGSPTDVISVTLPCPTEITDMPILCFVRDSDSGNIPYGIGTIQEESLYFLKSDFGNFTTGSGRIIKASGRFYMSNKPF